MSFERPGTPRPGHDVDGATEEALTQEGVEIDDHTVDRPDHPGAPSPGPQPSQPRHRRDTPPDAESPQSTDD